MTVLRRQSTGRRTVRGLAADQRILAALEALGPATAREIADRLRREVWEAWAERHGYDFEWGTDEEPLGARLLAVSGADAMGLPYLFGHQVYPRLLGLERRGEVERIQVEGRRPMLWRRAEHLPREHRPAVTGPEESE
jgi:hypothetical protein